MRDIEREESGRDEGREEGREGVCVLKYAQCACTYYTSTSHSTCGAATILDMPANSLSRNVPLNFSYMLENI